MSSQRISYHSPFFAKEACRVLFYVRDLASRCLTIPREPKLNGDIETVFFYLSFKKYTGKSLLLLLWEQKWRSFCFGRVVFILKSFPHYLHLGPSHEPQGRYCFQKKKRALFPHFNKKASQQINGGA